MKYKENPGPDNFTRFERLATQVLSVSNAVVKEKIAMEKLGKKQKKHSVKSSSSVSPVEADKG